MYVCVRMYVYSYVQSSPAWRQPGLSPLHAVHVLQTQQMRKETDAGEIKSGTMEEFPVHGEVTAIQVTMESGEVHLVSAA